MTAPSNDRSIGQLVADALDDVRAIIQHEKALAKAEVSRAAKAGGVGAGLLAAAAVVLSLSLVYLLIAAAEGLVAAGMTRWGGFLVVGGVLLLLAVVLALVGVASLKRVKGPQRAVEQGKGTVDDVRSAFAGDDADAVPATTEVAAPVAAGTRGTGRTD